MATHDNKYEGLSESKSSNVRLKDIENSFEENSRLLSGLYARLFNIGETLFRVPLKSESLPAESSDKSSYLTDRLKEIIEIDYVNISRIENILNLLEDSLGINETKVAKTASQVKLSEAGRFEAKV